MPPALVVALVCPDRRCATRVYDCDPEVFRGLLVCRRSSCRRRWWAMRFEAGQTLSQLREIFGEDLALSLALSYKIPAVIEIPMYWQIELTGKEYHASHGNRASEILRRVLARVTKSAA